MRYAAFLRAINVGNRRVKMDDLRAIFEEAGFDDVSTYIASGNVLFSASGGAADVERRIEASLAKRLGYDVDVFVRTPAQLQRVLSDVDDKIGAPGDGETIHVMFTRKAPPKSKRASLEALSNERDVLTVSGNHLLWLRRGPLMEASFDAASLEKALGQPGTMRTANTVRKMLAKL